MIFDLAEDIQNAVAKMPSRHSMCDELKSLSNSFVDCIVGVLDRPWLLKQTLINQIRSSGLEISLENFVRQADEQLDTEPCWMSLIRCTAVMRTWKNIVAISINQGLAHCASRPGEIDECDLATHSLVRSHWFSFQPFESVSVHPITQEVAVVGSDGVVESRSLQRRVQLRLRSACFAQIGAGFVGVDLDDRLKFYSAEGEPLMCVDVRLPTSGCSLHVGTTGEVAVLLAGDRPGFQQILFLRWGQRTDPSWVVWPAQDQVVTAASIGGSGTWVAVAILSRELLICDIESGWIRSRISLSRIGGRPLSEIVAISLSPGPKEQVIFTDTEAIVGIWDVANDELRRCGAYCAIREGMPLIALQWFADGERFAVATDQTVNIFSTSLHDDSVSSGTPVGAIGVHRDGWIALTHPMEKRVSWFEDGRKIAAQAIGYGEPGALAILGPGKEIAVDVASCVALLRPDREPTGGEGIPVFDQPTVSVLSAPKRVFAVSVSGEVKSVDFLSGPPKLLSPVLNNWEQHGACLAGSNGTIIGWGRETAGSARSKVFARGKNGEKRLIAELDRLIKCVAATGERRVFIAREGWVYRYDKTWRGWRQLASRAAEVQLLCACGTETLLAMRQDVPWLELWSAEDLSTLGATYVPGGIVCISCDGMQIAMGTTDGGYIHVTLRGTQWRVR